GAVSAHRERLRSVETPAAGTRSRTVRPASPGGRVDRQTHPLTNRAAVRNIGSQRADRAAATAGPGILPHHAGLTETLYIDAGSLAHAVDRSAVGGRAADGKHPGRGGSHRADA